MLELCLSFCSAVTWCLWTLSNVSAILFNILFPICMYTTKRSCFTIYLIKQQIMQNSFCCKCFSNFVLIEERMLTFRSNGFMPTKKLYNSRYCQLYIVILYMHTKTICQEFECSYVTLTITELQCHSLDSAKLVIEFICNDVR